MLRVIIAVLLLLILPVSFACAGKRVALVIGNSAYRYTPKLDNPKNDAADMAAALKKYGFVVIEGFDLDKRGFDQKVLNFAAALKGADAGVFFYAGHGMQVAGQNYLVPIDAKAEAAETLDFELVRMDSVQRIMERLTDTNILFLDACRDNPLARNLARSMGTRSTEIGRGLAQVEAGVGTLISFSTQPGNVALDGSGRNSPFAGALVRYMGSSNDDLSAILISVRNDVIKETLRKQVPWEHSALTGRFYFSAAAEMAEPSKPAMTPAPTEKAAPASPETIPPSASKGPDIQPSANERSENGPFDGRWQITKSGTGCDVPQSSFSLTISNGAVGGGRITGRVDKAGKFTFSHPSPVVKGITVHYSGQLAGGLGTGRFTGAKSCAGSFTARRQ
jgi:hypothetical protein